MSNEARKSKINILVYFYDKLNYAKTTKSFPSVKHHWKAMDLTILNKILSSSNEVSIFFGRLQTDLCAHRDSVSALESHKFPHDPKILDFSFHVTDISLQYPRQKVANFRFIFEEFENRLLFPAQPLRTFKVSQVGLLSTNFTFGPKVALTFLGCPLTIDFSGLSIYD